MYNSRFLKKFLEDLTRFVLLSTPTIAWELHENYSILKKVLGYRVWGLGLFWEQGALKEFSYLAAIIIYTSKYFTKILL